MRAAPSPCSPKCQVLHGVGIQLPGKAGLRMFSLPLPQGSPDPLPAERVVDPEGGVGSVDCRRGGGSDAGVLDLNAS